MWSWSKNPRRRRGANAIEFALTFPMFIMITAGMIDAGWLVMQLSAYNAAAHLGCRDGSTKDPGVGNVNIATVRTYAGTQALVRLSQYGGECHSCTVAVSSVYTEPGQSLKCVVTGNYTPLFGVIRATTVRSVSVVRLEFQR